MSMRDAAFVFLFVSALLFTPPAAGAEQAGKVWQIGYLSPGSARAQSDPASAFSALRQSLRQLGYVEGQNLVITSRYAEGDVARLSSLATELVRLKVAVIVAWGPAIKVAKDTTSTIPIVMATTLDAVAAGLVDSLARPGGNVTGLTLISTDLMGKRLELLREAFPGFARLALLAVSDDIGLRGSELLVRATEVAAKSLGVRLQILRVRDPREFDAAFAAMTRERADALYVLENPLLTTNHIQLIELASKHRLPTMFGVPGLVKTGGLMAYGPDTLDMNRRAAVYVDKLLKGAKPADLPVEQPTKFELVINRRSAKALALAIAPSLLMRADWVIE